MENPYIGDVEIQLGTNKLTLRYDWAALAKVYKLTEEKENHITDILEGRDVEGLAEITAIGLQRHHPGYSAQRVMEDSPPIVPLTLKIIKAIKIARNGVSEEEPQEEAPLPQASSETQS